MKTEIFVKCAAAFLLALITCAVADAQEPRTVTEHLLTLPNELFKLVDENVEYADPAPKTKPDMDKYRRSKIVVEDIKNGYIEYENNEFPTQIALFRKDGGGYLMAVSVRTLVHANKGQVCSGQLSFIEFNGTRWENVTEKYQPKLNAMEERKAKRLEYCYELPRVGRTLRLYSLFWDSEDTWGHFEWNGSKFVGK